EAGLAVPVPGARSAAASRGPASYRRCGAARASGLAQLDELLDLLARPRAVLVRVVALREAVEVVENLVVAADRPPGVEHEHRELPRAGRTLERVAFLGIGGHLAGDDVDAELRQPLPHAMRMRAPFGLVELHAPFPSRAQGLLNGGDDLRNALRDRRRGQVRV